MEVKDKHQKSAIARVFAAEIVAAYFIQCVDDEWRLLKRVEARPTAIYIIDMI